MKKWISGLVCVAMLVPGAVFATDSPTVLTPDAEVYETVLLIEEAAYLVTEDPADKALLQDELAENRLEEAEAVILLGGDPEVVEGLLADMDESLELVDENLAMARLNGEDIAVIEAAIAEKYAARTDRMNALLAREDLNEHAQAGIAKAIENQANAMDNIVQAKLRAGQGQENNPNEVTGQERAAQKQDGQNSRKPDTAGKGK